MLSTKASGTTCTYAKYTSIVSTVHHSHWYNLYGRQINLCFQYCPSQLLIQPLQTIQSTIATGTICTDAKYTSIVNIVHHSHWYYLYRRQMHLCCQYCPPQPLVLPVHTPNTPLLSILSITATGTTCSDAKYTSTVNTVHQSH